MIYELSIMKTSEKKRILIVEDEPHIAEGLELNLTLNGHDVRIAADGVAALREWKEWRPNLIVLDIMLPVMNGLSVLQNIRLEDDRLPILILSAKGTPQDRVRGLSCGCDDYLVKPFDLEEFMLRTERLLSRASSDISGEKHRSFSLSGVYVFGKNQIDFKSYTAYCNAGQIELTDQEIRLLKLFILNKGNPLPRNRLLEIGWGYSSATTTRTVDNFIVRFRKYFEDNPRHPIFFKSLRSVGYIFDDGKTDSDNP